MTQDEVLQVFRDTRALLEGHFVLRSGLHSRQFFQCALALQQMPIVEKLGAGKIPPVHEDEFDRLLIVTIPANGTPSVVTLRYGGR